MNSPFNIRELEAQLAQLEHMAKALEDIPATEVPGKLSHAVELLRELNSALELQLSSAESSARELHATLKGVDFTRLDEMLEDQQRRSTDEPG